MKVFLNVGIVTTCLLSGFLYAQESSDSFSKMFTDGNVSGELRSIYAEGANKDTKYAMAVGGTLKYELSSYKGLSGAVAFTTSQDIGFATGSKDDNAQNNELSSSAGQYTQLSEAYINYTFDGLNLRAGRQVLDTPLADNDDIRMIQNTFEAYMATYEISKFTITAGNIQNWQGYDAGLDNSWVSAGKGGTWLGGVSYSDGFDAGAWYYAIRQVGDANNAGYIDISNAYEINKDVSISAAVQYLHEDEVDNSGVQADIYGVMVESELYGVGITAAYNQAMKKAGKKSFSGLGGGALYTSMDTMILDVIADDRDAHALLIGLSYNLSDFNFFYMHGCFTGGENSSAVKEHIVEQNVGVEYTLDERLFISAVYVTEEDMQNSQKTDYDWSRGQIQVKYTF